MSPTPPDVLLFITPVCAHCPSVLQSASEMVKQALIGKLTVVNIAAHPDEAAEYGVRSAPWLRVGPFTLTGALSPAELKQWAEWARGDEGTAHYIEHLLKQGDYKHAVAFVAGDTHRLKALPALVANLEANISVRLGVSALLEAYADTPELRALLPQLAVLSRHDDHRVRADACHLLGLTGSAAARDYVAACLDDDNDEVREIAEEAMDELATAHAQ